MKSVFSPPISSGEEQVRLATVAIDNMETTGGPGSPGSPGNPENLRLSSLLDETSA